MKALVKTQKGKDFLELRDVPEPPAPGENEVRIKIAACGICGTDIHVKHDEFPYWPPVILGHELAGEIVACGPGVHHHQVGDRVVVEPHTKACGHCHLCRTGNSQICPEKRSPGWGIDGGMTTYINYPEKLLHKIPDHMTWEQAAVVEPTANAVTDLIIRTKMQPGDFVAVIGPGPIGLMTALVARAAGARDVAIIGTPGDVDLRFAKAKELGFKHLINIAETNAVDAILELTGGKGADVVCECSGSPRAIPTTVDLVRKRGKICVIGLTGNKDVTVPWDKFAFKVCEVIFNLSTEYESWDRTIALIASGQVPADKLITHKEPLENWEKAFTAIESLQAIKALLVP